MKRLSFAFNTMKRGWLCQGRSFCTIVTPTPMPLRALLQQVEFALESKLYYAALSLVFTLPDVCVTLGADSTKPFGTKPARYQSWFDANAARFFTNVNGEDCHRMRCGVLHNGQFGHSKSSYDRIVFLLPGSKIKAHDVIMSFSPDIVIGGKISSDIFCTVRGRSITGKVLLLDVCRFCETIMSAVENWSLSKIDDEHFRSNVEYMAYHRPDGISPLFVGIPVIA